MNRTQLLFNEALGRMSTGFVAMPGYFPVMRTWGLSMELWADMCMGSINMQPHSEAGAIWATLT